MNAEDNKNTEIAWLYSDQNLHLGAKDVRSHSSAGRN
jgi:hypothetical protein